MQHVTHTDDEVLVLDPAAPGLQQVVVHLRRGRERALPGREQRLVAEGQVGPDPDRLRRRVDDRGWRPRVAAAPGGRRRPRRARPGRSSCSRSTSHRSRIASGSGVIGSDTSRFGWCRGFGRSASDKRRFVTCPEADLGRCRWPPGSTGSPATLESARRGALDNGGQELVEPDGRVGGPLDADVQMLRARRRHAVQVPRGR